MLTTKKQVTLNGTSIIMENEKEIIVATMFASVDVSKKFNSTQSIIDNNAYATHADEVNADIQEFNAEALKLIEEA